jgi:multisubunit Na+/H+ antiporter MnhF subunit
MPHPAPLGIALLGLGLNIVVACRMGLTTDEGAHLAYGDFILRGMPDRDNLFFSSKMPVTALNSAPRMLGNLLSHRNLAPGLVRILRDLRTARMVTVASAFCLCLLVFSFAESLYGRVAGLFAQLLFVLSPNIIAHSTVATTDLYITLGTVGFLYFLRRFLLNPSAWNALLAASWLGFSQLTKFSGVYLFFVLLIVLISCLYGSRLSIKQAGMLLGLSAICSLALINVGFAFRRTFTPLARYEFMSSGFQALQRAPLLRNIPLPFPYAYLQGYDMTGYDNAHAVTFDNLTLLGEVRGTQLARSGGFASYYLVAYGLKEPIGMQILLLLSLLWIVRHRRFSDFLVAEWPLLTTAAVLLVALSFFNNSQVGIRHMLPVLAIFTIVSGAAFAKFAEFSRARKALLLACLVYTVVSVASYFPHMIPYFNEIVTDRKMAYRYLADSNLDWRQDRDIVAAFLEKNPSVKLDPPEPVTGWVLVRANLLAGVSPKKADYWLRERSLKPVRHVAYAHLLFWIPPA